MHDPAIPRGAYRASADEFLALTFVFLDQLLASWDSAERGLPASQVGVSWAELRDQGIPDSSVLYLLYQGHAEHLKPGGTSQDCPGCLVPAESLLLTEQSRIALTEVGRSFAERFLADVLFPEYGSFDATWDQILLGRFTPSYDGDNRLFVWGRHLLKRFRQPSGNQETILRAAEEMNWPSWFDDPLPKVPQMNPKVRLHDTIKWLNQRQSQYLIHFKGDGTGTRLGWEYH
jgi:hypothetical protein